MLGAVRGHQGTIWGVGVLEAYWGLAGTLGTQGPEGVQGHQGHWEAPRGVGGIEDHY